MLEFICKKNGKTKQAQLEANLEPSLRAMRQIAYGRSFKAAFCLPAISQVKLLLLLFYRWGLGHVAVMTETKGQHPAWVIKMSEMDWTELWYLGGTYRESFIYSHIHANLFFFHFALRIYLLIVFIIQLGALWRKCAVKCEYIDMLNIYIYIYFKCNFTDVIISLRVTCLKSPFYLEIINNIQECKEFSVGVKHVGSK